MVTNTAWPAWRDPFAFGGGMILLGQLFWAYNLIMTAVKPKPYDYRVDLVAAPAAKES